MLVFRRSGVAQAVGNGGAPVSAHRIGTFWQHCHIPFSLHIRVILHLRQNVPVSFQEHGSLLGEECRSRRSLRKIVLIGTPVFLLQVNVELHGISGGLIVKTSGYSVLRQYVAALLIHKIPVSQLVVSVGHIAVFSGGVIDLLGSLTEIIPSPGLIWIGYSCRVEHLLVVHQSHRVLVFGHSVIPAVASLNVL